MDQIESTSLEPNSSIQSKYKRHASKQWIVISVVAFFVILCIAGIAVGISFARKPHLPDVLSENVKVENIMTTLRAFEAIANKPSNKGSRGILEGWKDSFNYVVDVLQKESDCEISSESFGVPMFFEDSKPSMNYKTSQMSFSLQRTTDFKTMNFGGNGTYSLTGGLKIAKNFGCNKTDFSDLQSGEMVMVWYNPDDKIDCTAYQKALNAYESGAGAILIANDETRRSLSASRLRGSGYAPGLYQFVQVPVLAISNLSAKLLSQSSGDPNFSISIKTSTRILITPTKNLYCTTKEGNDKSLMIFGAHLDSVSEGPGINDNGSGAASLLEIVKAFYKLKIKTKSKIQFTWWGAEEPGLLGSRWFVYNNKLNRPNFFKTIKLALNFDTIASPNGVPQIYSIKNRNAANETFPESAHRGSMSITATFEQYFQKMKHPYELCAFEGGSDYYPFIQSGIPAGGLDAGADDILTVAQQKIFGGLSNAVNMPCYHEACDTVESIGVDMLGKMSKAAAYTIGTLALQENIDDYLNRAGKFNN